MLPELNFTKQDFGRALHYIVKAHNALYGDTVATPLNTPFTELEAWARAQHRQHSFRFIGAFDDGAFAFSMQEAWDREHPLGFINQHFKHQFILARTETRKLELRVSQCQFPPRPHTPKVAEICSQMMQGLLQLEPVYTNIVVPTKKLS